MQAAVVGGRKFRFIDFLLIPLRISPFLTALFVLNRVVLALMPSLKALAMAAFIDTALSIFGGALVWQEIYRPLIMLMALVAYPYVQQSVITIADGKFRIKMTEVFRYGIVEKRARLKFRHIENNDSWDLIRRVCEDPVLQILSGYDCVMQAAYLSVLIGSVIVILVTQAWWTALVMLAMTVPLFLVSIKSGKAGYDASMDAMKHTRRAEYLHTVLSGRENVEERALFGYGSAVGKTWKEKYAAAQDIEIRVTRKYYIRTKSASGFFALTAIAVTGVLIVPLSIGEITAGMFIGLATAITSMVQTMSGHLGYVTEQLARSNEYLKDLTRFADMEETEGALDLPKAPQGFAFDRIEFRDVTFRYPDTGRDILKNFSLTLEKNLHYAFVGVNGAGKTTIAKLLTGLYDNYEGEILLNGKELRHYTQAELKGLFAVVYQDFARYSISMRDNIMLGDLNKQDEARVRQAVETIGLSDAVRGLPDGLNTSLGKIDKAGVDLSGGQWQRVAIARALYSDAPVTVLDEPTAALDPVAESQVYELFGRISAGKTTIFITHRLGAARLADEIIVVDRGFVAEQGTHEALMRRGGIYAGMYDAQRSWYV